ENVALPPPGFVTVTPRGPVAAPAAIVRVAVMLVEDATVRFETVMPAPALNVAPATKPAPVIITGTAALGTPWLAVTEVIAMVGAVTEKAPASVPFPPSGFVTVTFRASAAALLARVSVAVIWVAEITVTFDAVTPVPPRLTIAPWRNPVPPMVTGTVAPCAPCLGATEPTAGARVLVTNTPPGVPA